MPDLHSLRLNEIYNMDCIDGMKLLAENSIDLTVTSPPYDNLRTYNNSSVWNFEVFKQIAEGLYRVTKQGGVVVWVVGDATINGSETGTSFRQALHFKDIGFNLHDTMIYQKNSSTYPANAKSNRYSQIFEYMFVFAKGEIATANLIADKQNKWEGFKDFSNKLKNPVPKFSPRNNIWEFVTSFNEETNHPAVFPEQLAKDHILSWSNEGDLILDPFMGSGTTAKMAYLQVRNYIGFEIDKEYHKLATERLEEVKNQLRLI